MFWNRNWPHTIFHTTMHSRLQLAFPERIRTVSFGVELYVYRIVCVGSINLGAINHGHVSTVNIVWRTFVVVLFEIPKSNQPIINHGKHHNFFREVWVTDVQPYRCLQALMEKEVPSFTNGPGEIMHRRWVLLNNSPATWIASLASFYVLLNVLSLLSEFYEICTTTTK